MRIAIVGPFVYPSSNANSQRINGIANAIRQYGNEVYICPGIKTGKLLNKNETEPQSDVEVHEIDEYGYGLLAKKLPGARGLFLGNVTVTWLNQLRVQPDVIILYGTHLGYLLRLLKYCKKKSIPLLLDIVEWHDPRHLPGGLFGPFSISNEISMRWIAQKANGILAISSWIETYYLAKGCQTLRTPPILSAPAQRPKQLRESNKVLTLCYVGTPGKKEEFALLFDGIKQALLSGVLLQLHIAGITEPEFKKQFKQAYESLKECHSIEFHGRISNFAARQLVASADFQILARQPARFSNAGFPFKVAESMMLGTPVLTNSFSDIPMVVQSGINSIIFNSLNPEEIKNTICLASSLSDDKINEMKKHARETAMKLFSVEANNRKINQFIETIRTKN